MILLTNLLQLIKVRIDFEKDLIFFLVTKRYCLSFQWSAKNTIFLESNLYLVIYKISPEGGYECAEYL